MRAEISTSKTVSMASGYLNTPSPLCVASARTTQQLSETEVEDLDRWDARLYGVVLVFLMALLPPCCQYYSFFTSRSKMCLAKVQHCIFLRLTLPDYIILNGNY